MRAFVGVRRYGSFLTNSSQYPDGTVSGYALKKDKSSCDRGRKNPSQPFSLGFRATSRSGLRT